MLWRVIGRVAGQAHGRDAVDVDLRVVVVVEQQLQAGIIAGRQVEVAPNPDVVGLPSRAPAAAGVPAVPKPPGPCFHPLASKSGFCQPSAGFSMV